MTDVHDSEAVTTVERRGTRGRGATTPIEPLVDRRSEHRFEDRGEIAEGGMAVVRRVFDHTFQREVARKEIKDFGDDEENREALVKFIEEARIVGQLEHPNIAPVYDLGWAQDQPSALTMKLVRGRTFSDQIAELPAGRLDGEHLRPVIDVVLRVCDALSFAHDRGVIHRDLKPSNVMVGSFGQVYLMDWGIALIRGAGGLPGKCGILVPEGYEPDPEGTVCGTPAFMSPEQAEGWISRIDERTDVYGIGAVLYRALCGAPPHTGDDCEQRLESARTGSFAPIEEVAPDRQMPPALCRIIEKALAVDPAERHQSIAEFQQELQRFLDSGGWFDVRRFARGETIMREGDPGHVAYVIEEGACQVLKRTEDGRDVEVAVLYPGNVFGETAIFTQQTRTASIVAQTDVALLEISAEAFQRELGRTPWLRPFIEAVAHRFVACEMERRALVEGKSDGE